MDYTKLITSFENGIKIAYQMYWDILMSFLLKNWGAVIIVLFVIFVIALVKAIKGRWGMLGKVLYNYIYFGTLFIIGLIWGPTIFVSNFITILCTIILYPMCYFLTGAILDKIGVRNHKIF